MSDSDSTSNTNNTTISIPIATKVEVEDPEAQKLFRAQENIPAVCEESVRLNRLLWSRRSSTPSIIRTVAVLTLIVIIGITTVVAAISSGDPSKLASAAVALNTIAQTLALNSNGTSASQKPGI